MRRTRTTAALGMLGLLAGVVGLAGCRFDGGRADQYRCGGGDTCPTGQVCDRGICVAAAPGDAGLDGAPPDGTSPGDGPVSGDGAADGPAADGAPSDGGQQDGGQQDGGQQDGGQQDAAQSDAAQSDAAQSDAPPQQDAPAGCVFDPLTSDAGNFTEVITAATWQFGATGYSQSGADDLHLTWVSAAGGDAVSIAAQVTPTNQGRSQFNTPSGNFASMAGVVVRASGITATNVTGYFCGVDLRGQRLLLGRMQGAYSAGNGVFTILGQQAMSVALNGTYPVSADAQGSAISCSSGITNVSVTDATITSGSVGLYTLGARARFTNALYCVP